jgi:hypothetical protein
MTTSNSAKENTDVAYGDSGTAGGPEITEEAPDINIHF